MKLGLIAQITCLMAQRIDGTLNESKLVKSAGSLSGDFFKIYLVRRHTKTQKYKGAVF